MINIPDKTLEGSLANEEIGRLLVPADLLESNGARAVAVGLLHSSSEGCRLAGSLYGESLGGGDFPPVVFRANCLIRAMVMICDNCVRTWVVGRVIWEGGNKGGREGGSFFLCLFAILY